MTDPKNYDVVMGGQTPNPIGSLVLGGIDGVQQQLASSIDTPPFRKRGILRNSHSTYPEKTVLI
ncbi:MAG: hypothetical protein ACLGGO_34320, partial [Coleofasciculus sp.]